MRGLRRQGNDTEAAGGHGGLSAVSTTGIHMGAPAFGGFVTERPRAHRGEKAAGSDAVAQAHGAPAKCTCCT